MAQEERRRRGTGSTYHDKAQDRYVAQLSLGVDRRTGRRRMVRRTTKDPDEVDALLAHLRRRYIGVGDVALQRLDDFLDDWLAAVKPTVAASTHRSYTALAELHIRPTLGAVVVAELRPSHVKGLIADCLDANLSPSSVHRVVGVLRMALGAAVRDGELPVNVARVKLPRVEHERVEAMTPEHADRILEAMKGNDILEPLVTLLLGTGMRLGEAVALDWRDLRLPAPGKGLSGKESVTVRLGKTKASRRTIPLPAFVARALVTHRGKSTRTEPGDPVFRGERGARLRRDVVSHAFPDWLEAKKLPKMRVHDLRHGTATLLVAKGVPLPVVAEVLGHADPSVTASVYSHVSLDSKRSAMVVMDRLRRASAHD